MVSCQSARVTRRRYYWGSIIHSQPRFDRSRIRLLRVSGNTLNYYIRTVDAVTEPPMIPFTADNDSLNSDSSQPALTVEISKSLLVKERTHDK